MKDKVEPAVFERIRPGIGRRLLDQDDREALVRILAVFVLVVAAALTLGVAVRVFIAASGLGG